MWLDRSFSSYRTLWMGNQHTKVPCPIMKLLTLRGGSGEDRLKETLCALLPLQHHHASSDTFRASPGNCRNLLTSLLASSLAHPPCFPQRHSPLSFAIRITSESLPWPPKPFMELPLGCVQPQPPLFPYLSLDRCSAMRAPSCALNTFSSSLHWNLCVCPSLCLDAGHIYTRSFFRAVQRHPGATQFKVAPC